MLIVPVALLMAPAIKLLLFFLGLANTPISGAVTNQLRGSPATEGTRGTLTRRRRLLLA